MVLVRPVFSSPEGFGTRHLQLLLASCALICYGLHSHSLRVGLVAMNNQSRNTSYPAFNTTMRETGLIYGMFGYGELLGNVIFGFLSRRIGPSRTASFVGGICGGFCSLIFPWASSHFGINVACAVRFIQGFFVSCSYPCLYAQMSKWVVPQEKSEFTWVWAGNQVGCLTIYLLAGPLFNSVAGWPGIFYFPGLVSIAWGVASCLYSADSPARHSSISLKERLFIESNIPAENSLVSDQRIPWGKMLTSVPLWALTVCQTCEWFGTESTIAFEPTYLNAIFIMSVKQVGFMAALNCAFKIPASLLMSYAATSMNQIVTVNFSRQFWNAVAMMGDALTLLLLAAFDWDSTGTVVLFVSMAVLNAATHPGTMTNVLDLAPNYASEISGILATLSIAISSAGPILTGWMVENQQDKKAWQLVFFLNSAVLVFGNIVFLIFGKTDVQAWNHSEEGTPKDMSKHVDNAVEIQAPRNIFPVENKSAPFVIAVDYTRTTSSL